MVHQYLMPTHSHSHIMFNKKKKSVFRISLYVYCMPIYRTVSASCAFEQPIFIAYNI